MHFVFFFEKIGCLDTQTRKTHKVLSHLTHWDGNWSYRSYIMADAEAAEKVWLFQTVVF